MSVDNLVEVAKALRLYRSVSKKVLLIEELCTMKPLVVDV